MGVGNQERKLGLVMSQSSVSGRREGDWNDKLAPVDEVVSIVGQMMSDSTYCTSET